MGRTVANSLGALATCKAVANGTESVLMNLNEYLATAGAMTEAELCSAAGIKNRDQLRQWRHGYAGRKPGAAYCVAIEKATKGLVTRQELRPDDWEAIWPELRKRKAKAVA